MTDFSTDRILLPIIFAAILGLQPFSSFGKETQSAHDTQTTGNPSGTGLTPTSGPYSHIELDISSATLPQTVSVKTPKGSTALNSLTLQSAGSSSLVNATVTKVLSEGTQIYSGLSLPLTFDLVLDADSKSVDIQVVLQAAQKWNAETACTLSLKNSAGVVLSQVNDAVSAPHQASLQIPKKDLKPSLVILEQGSPKILPVKNTFTISGDSGCSSANYVVGELRMMPMQIFAEPASETFNALSTSLFAQFGEVNSVLTVVNPNSSVPQGQSTLNPINEAIWTRGYGLAEDALMIPGPTLYFSPGDILSVNLVNKLNRDSLNALNAFEDTQSASLNKDDILDGQSNVVSGEFKVSDQIRQEVNIPHNLNNTNLHVHGLHVDPEKDDVTIVVIPDSEHDEATYDAPAAHTHGADFTFPTKVGDLSIYNEGSVADRPVSSGNWGYQYKIPDIHLPGSHWFHPHKHGSTSSQVENGMAGSLVIQEAPNNAIVSGFPSQEARTQWEQAHDSVLMIQEIANYGVQQGQGNGQGNQPGIQGGNANETSPTITVNGLQQPSYELEGGQLQRWRFVNAGANHRAFSRIWLGEKVANPAKAGTYMYQSKTMYLVAVDGITLDQKVEVTANNPLLLSPGNRADVLVQIDHSSSGINEYTMFKYFPTGFTYSCSSSSSCPKSCSCSSSGNINPSVQNATVSNQYLFKLTGYNQQNGNNYSGFQQQWNGQGTQSVMPLIKVKPDSSGNFLALDVAFAGDFPKQSTQSSAQEIGRWQPAQASPQGNPVPSALFNLTITPPVTGTFKPSLPSDTHMASIHLKNKYGDTPSYTSTINQSDIFQSRPVIFDVSNVKIKVSNSTTNQTVSQFTLNGRPFALNDPVGNSTEAVNERIRHGISVAVNEPTDGKTLTGKETPVGLDSTTVSQRIKEVDVGTDIPSGQQASCLNQKTDEYNNQQECEINIAEQLGFASPANAQSQNWTNAVNSEYFWTNAGYYQAIQYDSSTKNYSFQPTKATVYSPSGNTAEYPAPSWQFVSGLEKEAVVNTNYTKSGINVSAMTTSTASQPATVPGLPVATTAEEWIFINNSDIGHPFHIHINPFFVTEVGQLSYEQFTVIPPATAKSGSAQPQTFNQWVMRSASMSTLDQCDPTQNVDTVGPDAGKNCNGIDQNASVKNGDNIRVYQGNSQVMVGQNGLSQFVGNWWDTVIIPPHGYVKMRYWFNVPNQTGDYDPLTKTGAENCQVKDDDNKLGIWVYHCHILRHEDRGMMQPVITQPYIAQ